MAISVPSEFSRYPELVVPPDRPVADHVDEVIAVPVSVGMPDIDIRPLLPPTAGKVTGVTVVVSGEAVLVSDPLSIQSQVPIPVAVRVSTQLSPAPRCQVADMYSHVLGAVMPGLMVGLGSLPLVASLAKTT
jgi:hypothetical protein